MMPEGPEQEPPRTAIGLKTATILYLALGLAAFATMHGKALALSLIIVLGLAVKSYLHHWREKQRD